MQAVSCELIKFCTSYHRGSVDKCFENYERIADIYVTDEKGEAWSGVSGKMLPHLQQRTWNGVEGFTLEPKLKAYYADNQNNGNGNSMN